MVSPQAELTTTVWPTLIRANYPDPTALDNAIDLTTWKTKGTDPFALLIASAFINARGPDSIGWNAVMTAAQKKALYNELSETFTLIKTTVDVIQAALAAAYTALP